LSDTTPTRAVAAPPAEVQRITRGLIHPAPYAVAPHRLHPLRYDPHEGRYGGPGLDCRHVPAEAEEAARRLGWTWDCEAADDAACFKFYFSKPEDIP
jgi:hypothetical protein